MGDLGDVPAAALLLVVSVVLASALIRSHPDKIRSVLWASFTVHMLSALSIVAIVRAAYGGGADMVGYFRVGSFLSAHLRADFVDMAPRLLEVLFQRVPPLPVFGLAAGSNTASMQSFSAFMCLLTGDSLYAINILVALVSFVSKLMLFTALKAGLTDVPSTPIAVGCMLVPSAVFWSTGLLKEPIAVAGLSAMVYGGHLLVNRDRWVPGLVALLCGGVVAGLFKGYLLPPFGIGVGFFYVSRALFASGRTVRPGFLVLGAVLALVSILITGAALPHFAPEAFADQALDAQSIGERVTGGSTYSYGGGSLLSQLPLAMATVLYRPLIFEISGFLVFANALETLAAAVLTIVALWRTSLSATVLYVLNRPELCFCIGFVLTLAAGVGLTTTNLGTLSRYRMPLVPFYATFLLVVASRHVAAPAARLLRPPARFVPRLGTED